MAMLTVSGAGKKIKDEWVVDNVSFSQEPLEKIAVAGETGSGKTTLLKMIGGHEQINDGEIKFLGRDILGTLDK
jgi:iron(III) transport system ATP-binding protein